MIVVDTSALIAILLDEPQGDRCRSALLTEETILLSAGTLSEARIVAARLHRSAELAALLAIFSPAIRDVSARTSETVHAAYIRYGKGFHPARLNFGDCFAYALAETEDCPLLYVGNDFAQTAIRPALLDAPN